MESDNSDSSTSDEEYIPPTKLSKNDGDASDSSENESDDEGVSDDELRSSSGKRPIDGSTTSTNCLTQDEEAKRKAKEDAIWDDFLSSVEHPTVTKSTREYVEVSKKYQFAGEEIQVTERVPVEKDARQSEAIPLSRLKTVSNGDAVPVSYGADKPPCVNPVAKRAAFKPSGVASALNSLKSLTGNKAPKLSTLEKSRMDWKNFVRKENIEDDLKAHNKGKQGYLERRAFIDRTTEREYAFQKSQTSRKA